MKSFSFAKDEVPANLNLHTYMEQKCGIDKNFKFEPIHKPDRYFQYKVKDVDFSKVLSHTNEILEKNEFQGFTSSVSQSKNRSKTYGGFSVTYNPDMNVDANVSSLGMEKINLKPIFNTPEGIKLFIYLEEYKQTTYFYNLIASKGILEGVKYARTKGFNIELPPDTSYRSVDLTVKNSYFDTWGFNKLTPNVSTGYWGDFLSKFKCDIVRSRCALLRPGFSSSKYDKEYLWHSDESYFTNFRINIPLLTNSNFYLEDKLLGNFYFEQFLGHSWDTTKLHRAAWDDSKKYKEEDIRIALVIGLNPWFKLNRETNRYESNEFFMKKHPFDMLVDGDFIDLEWIK